VVPYKGAGTTPRCAGPRMRRGERRLGLEPESESGAGTDGGGG
jgi:hypothetical protein